MHQRPPFELEQRLARIAVVPILPHRVFDRLARPPPTITTRGFRASAGSILIAIFVDHIEERFLFPLKLLQTGISENRWAQFPPDTGQVPTILVVVIDAAEMQDDAIEASEISSAARMRACGGHMHHFFLKLLSAGIAENLGRPR
jgi:hypothetical protein